MRADPTTESISAYISKNTISVVKPRSSIAEKAMSALLLAVAGLGIILGCLSLSLNSLDSYPVPLLIFLGLCVLPLFFFIRRAKGTWEWKLIIIFVLSVGSAYVLSILPEYLYGFQINGIIHHSFVSALVLLGISIPSFCYALYYLLGATPKAYDLSHYPIIVIPVFLMLAAYAILIYRVFALGVPHLSWHILTTPFVWQDWQQEVWQNGWPQWVSQSIHQAGLSNYILGTLLLIAMTSLISLPIGMGVGIYITEYSTGVLSKIIKFSCNALRSISVFILGLIAFALVRYTSGTFLSTIFAGYFYDLSGNRHIANGSFVTASIVISLLVIPIIARATEEGIRSIPQEMKEGSLALGASREHTLRHILIPWTLPNTVTGLLLGCAEASGSLATIWFIAGTGQYGVGPFNQVTSLSYFIYFARGDIDMNFKQVEGSYQFTAALILILITIGLSVAAVMLKRRFSKRYKVA